MKKYKDKKQYRYEGYDYSQDGFYYVTICMKDKELFFGKIENEKVALSDIGLIADKYWQEIPKHFKSVILDEYIIMPNHIHGIIQIKNDDKNNERSVESQIRDGRVGTGHCPVPTVMGGSKFGHVIPGSLSTIIGSYKSFVTKTINNKNSNTRFAWQTRFHDRIIRTDDELNRARQYIMNNPLKWELDRNYKD